METPKMTLMNNNGGNEGENLDIIPDDTKLEKVNKTKFLGVIIDENVTWKNHIDGITKTISRNIGMINKLNAHVKWHLEPTYLKSSPLFTFSTKALGQDLPSVHFFSLTIGSRFTAAKINLGEDFF